MYIQTRVADISVLFTVSGVKQNHNLRKQLKHISYSKHAFETPIECRLQCTQTQMVSVP